MYKKLALINGAMIATMAFCNVMLTSIAGPYMSTLIFHTLALILTLFISLITKNKFSSLKQIPYIYFLPGILGVVVILINNICMPKIGITLAIGVCLFGQLIMSNLVEHFGLFGMPVNKFKKEKLFGFSIISLGIIAMITM